MNRLALYSKYVIGLPLFFIGWYFFFVSTHLLLNSEAGITRIVLGGTFGLLGVLVGGYIISPIIADQIADGVMERVRPLLDFIPGGRRRTDPPIPPSPLGGGDDAGI
jgi:hypothetical protein